MLYEVITPITGIDVLTTVKAKNPKFPVLILSGYLDDKSMEVSYNFV